MAATVQGKSSHSPTSVTKTGIDVLEEENFDPLRSKRVGLITNQSGVDSRQRRTIDVLLHAPHVKVVALFSPEHGLAGRADAPVANSVEASTGLPVYSLYADTRRPTDTMLAGIDALVFDVQDAGVRFYTYIATMAYCMEAAAKRHIPFFVLDRPNPLGGEIIEGPMLDADRLSFTGYFPLPVRYAMTMGELAQMFNAENRIGADLHVIALMGWRRADTYDRTGLPWIPPSPNLRSISGAFLYPGIEILQAGGVSVGRGTDTPFELIGAPWIQGAALTAELNAHNVPGVRFQATTFTPDDSLYKGEYCQGISIKITDRDAFRSMRLGLEIAAALHKHYPRQFHIEKMIALLGSQGTLEQLQRGVPAAQIVAGWSGDLDGFRAIRKKYLLYQ